MATVSRELEHFIRLAKTGKVNRGASGGEKRAWRLAERILDDVPGLDGQAVEGMVEFIRLTESAPMTMRDLFE